MSDPLIELIPSRPAVCSDATITLDVLIRITPPTPEVHFPRPALNLALVLDRSGSMEGAKKMAYAREAAAFAVRQLLPVDRVSVTTFDDRVETIVPSTLAVDKAGIVRAIEAVEPRGSTNLHGGWAEGARQAESHLVDGGLNRVLLLSDGLTNQGVTDPTTIANEASGQSARGVSTTTLGVGHDYNEDLMEAMARAGDGQYYYIESPIQLVDIFQTELRSLMATLGQKVSLGLEPEGGVAVASVLNDFDRVPTGRLMLPSMVVGMPISVVARLTVPARDGATSPLAVRLAWDDLRTGERRTLRRRLAPLPLVRLTDWAALPVDPSVLEQEALLNAARAQKEASRASERGDLAGTRSAMLLARGYAQAAPMTSAVRDELAAIDTLDHALVIGDDLRLRKLAKFRSYGRNMGRTAPSPPAEEPPKST